MWVLPAIWEFQALEGGAAPVQPEILDQSTEMLENQNNVV
jgi:hypothetical protein